MSNSIKTVYRCDNCNKEHSEESWCNGIASSGLDSDRNRCSKCGHTDALVYFFCSKCSKEHLTDEDARECCTNKQ